MGEEISVLLSNMAQLEIELKDSVDLAENDDEACSSKRFLRTKTRSSSDDSLHRTRNRKVQKPKKNVNGYPQFETEKELKAFYLNINKKVKFKPVLLETIYEKDESIEEESQETAASKEIGRKMKRMITICNGLNLTKALKEKRKIKGKKHLGNRKRPKKIALAKFMEYFKEKSNGCDDAEVVSDP